MSRRIGLAGWVMTAWLCLMPLAVPRSAPALPAKLDPSTAPAQMAAFVDYWSNLHKPGEKGALGEYQLAQMADPGNVALLEKMSLYQNQSDVFYGDILAFLPDNVNANTYLGQNLLKDGFAALALPHFLNAQAHVPLNDTVAEWTGLSAYLSDDYATCERMYGESVRLLPNFIRRVRHGDCLAMQGRKDEARAEFAAAKALDVNQTWYFPIRMMDEGIYDGCKGTASEHMKKARTAMAARHNYEMYSEARWARICAPDDPETLQVLAEVEAVVSPDFGDYSFDTKAHARRLANLKDGGQTDAKRAKSSELPGLDHLLDGSESLDLSKNDATKVVAAYLASRVILLDPANPRARLVRARAFNNLKVDALAPQAWVDTDYALKDTRTVARAHHVRGVLLNTYGDPAGATAELSQAIAADPTVVRFYLARASAHMGAGNNAAALTDLNTVIGREPSDEGWLMRAETRRRLKDYSGAREDTLAVMERTPKSRQARSMEIRILDESGQRDVADLRHWAWLRDDEDAARADKYVGQRNASVVANYDREKAENAAATGEAHVRIYLTTLYDDYDAAYNAFYDAAEDEDLDTMRAARSDLYNMIKRGERFYDEADSAYATQEQRDVLERNLATAREAYADMKDVVERVESETGDYEDEDDDGWYS